jgi:tRNA/tmRNA/rRNA uracil-C5-methylase (TrmA/RlmC/RlmD family)
MIEIQRANRFLKPGCTTNCPGCAHKHLTREQSLAQKEKWLKNKLSAWETKFIPIHSVGEKSRWSYRNKICLSTRWKHENWQFGLIKNETIIPIHDCPVHTRQICEAVSLFSSSLPPAPIFPLAYFVQTGSQITLVVKSKKIPDLTWLDDRLITALKQIHIKGVWLHLHPCTGKKVFAKNAWHLLYGSERSFDENQFTYGPKAFQQLIPELYNQTLSSAESFLNPAAEDIVIDLYCGIGTGLARWQKRCANVMGVELDGEAVACARENTVNVEILRGKCRDRIPQLLQWTDSLANTGFRLLYVNPPRTGLEPEILQWIVAGYKPHRMAYLSCSAGTLQKNLVYLENNGYEITGISPYDFFPQTIHVETMVFLESKMAMLKVPHTGKAPAMS